MMHALQQFVRGTDAAVARLYLSVFPERNALRPFMFHSLFRDHRDIELKLVDPLQRTTIAQFRQFIEYYLSHDYQFVSPPQVLRGLKADRRYAMITFDDGYYNNQMALPILEEYGVPAVFFIATNHVLQQKCFWWDAYYRERSAQGAGHQAIQQELRALKCHRNDELESILIERFGRDVLQPRGEIDRPFTPAELREFARSPYVHLGNHTADHAILINYSDEDILRELETCQRALEEITGQRPTSIAYCNGNFDDRVLRIAREVGLRLGFTIRAEKTPLPLRPDDDMMRIGRFCLHADLPLDRQLSTYRSDLQLYGTLRGAYVRLARGHA